MSDLLGIVERAADNLLLAEEYLAQNRGRREAVEGGAPPAAGGAL